MGNGASGSGYKWEGFMDIHSQSAHRGAADTEELIIGVSGCLPLVKQTAHLPEWEWTYFEGPPRQSG